MAPEVIELKGASTKSDIWSLGCTIVELCTGKPPYSDLLPMTALFRIVEDDFPPLPDGLSPVGPWSITALSIADLSFLFRLCVTFCGTALPRIPMIALRRKISYPTLGFAHMRKLVRMRWILMSTMASKAAQRIDPSEERRSLPPTSTMIFPLGYYPTPIKRTLYLLLPHPVS